MEFLRKNNPVGGAKRYRMTSSSDNGVQLFIYKYEQDEAFSPLLRHVLSVAYLKEKGVKMRLHGQSYLTLEEDHVAYCISDPVTIPTGTVIIDGYVMKPKTSPHIVISVTDKVMLTHEEWRRLKFEVDELFMAQKQMPWEDTDDTVEEDNELKK